MIREMKIHRELTDSELYNRVSTYLTTTKRGLASRQEHHQAIASLLKLEYIERDCNDPNRFRYVL